VAPAQPATVQADPDQLRRALGNLVKNAIEAQPAPARVEVSIEGGDAWVRVLVRDHGAGVAKSIEGPELMAGLRSGKRDGAERGLGLPIAHKIIHDHGGRLRLEPASPRGTLAVVELPAVGAA
jgi:signal transduction histidine kinase